MRSRLPKLNARQHFSQRVVLGVTLRYWKIGGGRVDTTRRLPIRRPLLGSTAPPPARRATAPRSLLFRIACLKVGIFGRAARGLGIAGSTTITDEIYASGAKNTSATMHFLGQRMCNWRRSRDIRSRLANGRFIIQSCGDGRFRTFCIAWRSVM